MQYFLTKTSALVLYENPAVHTFIKIWQRVTKWRLKRKYLGNVQKEL